VPRQEALDARDEVAFFQTVKAALVKTDRRRYAPDLRLRPTGDLRAVL